jgi:hypothetical protein
VGWANGQQLKEPLGPRWCRPGGRAGHRAAPLAVPCPCHVMGQVGGPCIALAFGLCRGHAKRLCRGPCCWPMGRLEIYNGQQRERHILRGGDGLYWYLMGSSKSNQWEK